MPFYLSLPANPHLVALARRCGRKDSPVELRPLTELPPAQPQRLGPLRVEQTDLLTNLAFINWALVLLRNGTWQPDAELQATLTSDKGTLETRLLAVNTLLHGQEGGPSDGG